MIKGQFLASNANPKAFVATSATLICALLSASARFVTKHVTFVPSDFPPTVALMYLFASPA